MFCPRCALDMQEMPELAGQLVACPRCSSQFTMPGQPIAPQPAVIVHRHYHRGERDKSAGMVAALLSFLLPGLGQMCQGRIGVGMLFFISAVVAAVLSLFLIGIPLLVIIWLWAVVDAAWGSE